VQTHLERDEFSVTYDATRTNEAALLAAVREAGYAARVVPGAAPPRPEDPAPGPKVHVPILDQALAQGRRDNKLILIDFSAPWCVPCVRLEKETFADAKVAGLLGRFLVVKIDPDDEPELARRYAVAGLPDVRVLGPDGTEKRKLRTSGTAAEIAEELEAVLRAPGGAD
jgi:thiol:disulfide interchange protein